ATSYELGNDEGKGGVGGVAVTAKTITVNMTALLTLTGGDGGNGGCAILGEIVVENMSGSISMTAGAHGFGGNGAGNNPKRGADGKSTETVICEFSYQKSK
ncbi:MAG: hypothetical protein IKU99_00730, partial [Clostridia bacterium]|nr:hypothetical protein [Clostridia bacterium]